MIAGLRRRHRVAWLLLATLLVLAYVAALRARPQEPRMESLPPVLAPAAAAATPHPDAPDSGRNARLPRNRESERSTR